MREWGGVFVRVKKGNYLAYLCLSFANKLCILIVCNVLRVKVPGNISQRFDMFLFLCFSLSLLTFFPLFLILSFPSCWQQYSFISCFLFPGFPFHCTQYIPFLWNVNIMKTVFLESFSFIISVKFPTLLRQGLYFAWVQRLKGEQWDYWVNIFLLFLLPLIYFLPRDN